MFKKLEGNKTLIGVTGLLIAGQASGKIDLFELIKTVEGAAAAIIVLIGTVDRLRRSVKKYLAL